MNVTVSDHGVNPTSLEDHTIVHISITDSNDNPPIFSGTDITFDVPENQQVGLVVGQIYATDRDTGANGRITFELNSSTGNMIEIAYISIV